MLRVISVVLLLLAVLGMALPVVVGAQDGGSGADPLLALTLGELVAVLFGLVGTLVAAVSLTANYARGGGVPGGRGLDSGLAALFDARRRDTEFVGVLEKLVAAQSAQQRQMLKDVGELVFNAARWTPSEAIGAAGELAYELVDGVPLEEKLAELERERRALEQEARQREKEGDPPGTGEA